MKYRKGIFFVTFIKDKDKIKFLILKRKLHWKGWEFPKAGLEEGERNEKAVRRELKEETGLKAKKIIEFDKRGKFNYERKFLDRPETKGQSWKLFAVEVSDNKVKIDKNEHSDYRWLEFDEAHALLTWKNQKDCLLIIRNFLIKELYKNFRIYDSGNNIFTGGKNAEQNEQLMREFSGKDKIIMHTSKPGSPFCVNLTGDEDEIEMALFCAKYSRDWKKNKGNVEVHVFNGKDVYKRKDMNTGTFGVKKFKRIKVKKEDILKSQKKLR